VGVSEQGQAPGPNAPEWITAGATVVAALAAIVALRGAWRTIRDNRDIDRRRVTHESVARLESPELIESKAVMSSFLRGGLRPGEISAPAWTKMNQERRRAQSWRHLSQSAQLEDRRTVAQIAAYPNMLEGVAGMYNRGLLDERIVKTRVEIEARNFWRQAGWWLKAVKSGDNEIFEEIDEMLKHLNEVAHPKADVK
jgi:hypothetical protein